MAQLLRDNSKYIQWMIYIAAAVLIFLWLQPLIASKTTSRIIQSTINGVFLGGIYAVIALGIVIINKASGVFNFAHGGMMMISGFVFFTFFTTSNISFFGALLLATVTVVMVITTASWTAIKSPRVFVGSVLTILALTVLMTFRPEGGLSLGSFTFDDMNWINALFGATTATVLIGLLIERFTIRPLIGQPIFAAVMVTLALAEILAGLTTLIWGTQPKSLTIFGAPNPFTGGLARINTPIVLDTTGLIGSPINIDQPRLFAFIIAMIAFAAFFLFFRYTNIGLAMRATSEDQQLAESVGLRVRVILAVTWGIAAVMAGIAGVLQVGASDSNALSTDMQFVALRAFPAVLLGGLESITGALVGGILLGLTEEWAKMLFNSDVASNMAPYVLLMLVLIIRPEGLFGEKRIERI
ncbi:MAG: branched-chain amino acid ABC transporter permease [Phototrophicaceae bacterium]